MFSPTSRCRCLLLAALCGLVGLTPGCQRGPKQVPVTGHVTVDGKALTTGKVTFKPNPDKGNTFPGEPIGDIDDQGEYTLTTNGKPGAPVGWYKVIVPASVPQNPKDAYSMPRWLVNEKYLDANKTPLEVEVTETPPAGAYDLKLAR